MKISILTDRSSWMNKYNLLLSQKLHACGHLINLIHTREELKKGDIAFFLSCFEIISREYLDFHKNNIVVHASNLPQGRGWSPASWQILEGKNEIPITLFEASESVDAGKFYIKDSLFLSGDELLDEWQNKLGCKIIDMCYRYVSRHEFLEGIPQQGTETFYRKRKPQDSQLNIDQSINEQFNLLRIVDNEHYPAFFFKNNKKYILKIYPAGNE